MSATDKVGSDTIVFLEVGDKDHNFWSRKDNETPSVKATAFDPKIEQPFSA